MEPGPGAANLQVRTRRIRSGGGSTVTEFLIDCPVRRSSIPAHACDQCEDSLGVAAGDGHAPSAVACTKLWPEAGAAEAAATLRDALGCTSVLRAASRDVMCVASDLPLRQLAGAHGCSCLNGATVVDDGLRPIGMITKTDLMRRELEVIDDDGDPPPGVCGTVKDAMTAGVTTIAERASLLDATSLMADRGVFRLAITGGEGQIVGVITAIDVLRWLSLATRAGTAKGPAQRQ